MARKGKVRDIKYLEDLPRELEKIAKQIELAIEAKDANDNLLVAGLSKSKQYRFEATAAAGKAVQELWASVDKTELNKIDREIDALWKAYRNQYAEKIKALNEKHGTSISPDIPDSRKQEFIVFLLANQLEGFMPKDNLAAYITGDINLDSGERIQLKGPNSQFLLAFRMSYISKEFAKWTLPRSEAVRAADSKLWENIGRLHLNAEKINEDIATGKARQTPEKKAELMRQYKTISAADWYVFEFPVPPLFQSGDYGPTEVGSSGLSVSVSAERIVDFVKYYPEFFQVDSRRKDFIKYSLRFMLNKSISIPAVFKVGITEPKFAIHYQASNFFYYTRGLLGSHKHRPSDYSDSDIKRYNSNINANRNDFMLIHNNLFGGLDY